MIASQWRLNVQLMCNPVVLHKTKLDRTGDVWLSCQEDWVSTTAQNLWKISSGKSKYVSVYFFKTNSVKIDELRLVIRELKLPAVQIRGVKVFALTLPPATGYWMCNWPWLVCLHPRWRASDRLLQSLRHWGRAPSLPTHGFHNDQIWGHLRTST